ncbi:MAG TPA: ATP-grasp domain-containing protein [Anaerolineae bacterium]|nr:ATP-grasp domain-containing protein [Anaerolineae bacterium]
MKVLVLYNNVLSIDKGETKDLVSAQGVAIAARAVEEALRPGHDVVCLPVDFDPSEVLGGYEPEEWVVFNLLEGLGNRADLEPEAVAILGGLGYRYTGSPPEAMALCLNKAASKRLLESRGVPTPVYQVCEGPDAEFSVPLPAIVKPVAEDASLGIDDGAVVRTLEELRDRVRYIVEMYHEPALVEEFIEGREFNIALWGNGTPECLPLAEIDYSAFPDPLRRICSYAAKWEPERAEYHLTPVTCPANVASPLAERIREVAIAAYEAAGCSGYARVDMRERGDQPYVLEINPNPDISPDAGFARAALAAGYSYPQMVEKILAFAA